MRRTLLAVCSLSLFLIPIDLLAQKKDALTTFQFALKTDGTGVGETMGFFKSVSGLGSETEVVEYREGGASGIARKLVGVTKWSNIVLKRGFTGERALLAWRMQVERGQADQVRRNLTLILLDKSNVEVSRWTLTNDWPSKLVIEVDQGTGELQEVVEIAADVVTRQ